MMFHTTIYDITHAFLILAEVKNVVRNLSIVFGVLCLNMLFNYF